ncbi:MAG: dihydrolipoyl dehydrogenase [Acidilobaceae archaeon]|nr:dihydrolipoyl dehydrogenase [Acidilobaceae archaeon]
MKYDLLVIGGGPGGYPAAIRASQLGMSVALVEQRRLGGECTNYGCIPTKSLIWPVSMLHSISRLGFVKMSYEVDFGGLMSWAEEVKSKISESLESLLRKYGVEIYEGRAKLGEVVEVEGGPSLRGEKVLLAMGTEPAGLPGLEVDGALVHDNRSILSLRRKPSRVLIVGAGYIGVEYAALFAKLGSEVHLVEALEKPLATMDEDFSRLVTRRLSKLGVKLYFSTSVREVERRERYLKVGLTSGVSVEVDIALVAVGRRPNSAGAERLGVRTDTRGYVEVDGTMRTSNPNVFAAGDLAGPPLLAHKAFAQALVAAENAAGRKSYYEPKVVPSVVYFDPELVSVGLTEAEARRAGYEVSVAKLPIGGVARAVIEDSVDGFVKLVYESGSKALLGIHMAGPHVSELAGEASLAIEMGATLEDLALTIHPHPTISEALQEAAELALGKPKHYYKK